MRPGACRAVVRGGVFVLFLAGGPLSSLAPTAFAADSAAPPTIRDLVIGAPVAAQPANFQEFACGTNGGPPSLRVDGFADFARCPSDANGLHEVQFRYDDEPYYRALAARDALRASVLEGMRLGNFQIVGSALFDDAGILRGIRAVTDNRVPNPTRREAFGMAEFVRALYGASGWQCTDLPPAEGETPLGNRLVKEDCRKLSDDGMVLTTQARLLHREGQTLVDPANGQLRPGLFESTGRLEIYQADADGNPVYGTPGTAPQPIAAAVVPAPADPAEAFLAGVSRDCPGCDLAGANLKRRDLAGADLTGADLTGAVLHRARLAGAKLDGARLGGADLNVADLKRASLTGADLSNALLYQADAAGADLTGAILDNAVIERARLTSGKLGGVHAAGIYGPAANLAGADLTSATLTGAVLFDGDLQRAVLVGADLTDASFYRARLRSADLAGVRAANADFLQADLSDASLTGADLSGARLLRARVSGANLAEANTSGAVLPDGKAVP